jgi:glutamate/tyrosine decarboxylase-like PLP-dependent enzyme
MRARLRELEAQSRQLDPGPADRDAMLGAVNAALERFLTGLRDRGAYRGGAVSGAEDLFRPPDAPGGLGDALALIDDVILSNGINPASGGHFGYISGGGLYPSALGDLIADVTNRYSGVSFASPGAALLEHALIRWMTDLAGLPAGAGGDLTSGGSIANLSAIVTAREAASIGSRDVPTVVAYLSEQTHHCVDKALRIAGLSDCTIRRVAVDERWRMLPAALDAAVREDRKAGLRPWLVVATAGTTDVGAVDPLAKIADVADAHGLWTHVDAAYGGFFLLTDAGRARLSGIERADTIVMDPHKSLFLPFGSGALLARDAGLLAGAHAHTANYMQDARAADSIVSPADLGPELTRPFRGLRVWLPLQLFGLAAFRACLEEKLQLAHYFHRQLSLAPGFEMGPAPELSVVTYRYVPSRGNADEFNRRLLQTVHEDGRVFISSTRLRGQFVLRYAALQFRGHLDETDYLLELLIRNAAALAGH